MSSADPRVRTVLTPGQVITDAAWPRSGPADGGDRAAVRAVHVIRIGGAGMSAVARLALEAGLSVSGSDSQDGQFIAPLREAGARIDIGFAAQNLPEETDLVIVSTAVRPDNPEVLAARERGIPVIHRAAALAGLLGERAMIAVAGTHGKTSTTAMATMALRGAGLDPAWALGAAVPMLGRNAGYGSSGIAVVEADESDGSFLAFAPRVLLVTNLEPDHLDFHGTSANLTAAFDALVHRLPEGGTLVVCADDPGARALGERAARTGLCVQTYGTGPEATWRVLAEEPAADGTSVRCAGPAGETTARLRVFGHHNVLNALGALAAASALTTGTALTAGTTRGGTPDHEDLQRLLDGIAPFTGASRRFEKRGTVRGVSVYDDYAHHPSEVAATVRAARGIVGDGRVIAVFQPHLYSRTRDFAADFASALAHADAALVMPVYGAREDPDPTVTADTITSRAREGARLTPLTDRAEVAPRVAAAAHEGDVVLLLGAGDVVEETDRVLAALAEGAAEDGR